MELHRGYRDHQSLVASAVLDLKIAQSQPTLDILNHPSFLDGTLCYYVSSSINKALLRLWYQRNYTYKLKAKQFSPVWLVARLKIPVL